jgi:putative spermidine/putrescine transport system permease protein
MSTAPTTIPSRLSDRRATRRSARSPWILLAPVIALYGLVMIYPLLLLLIESFQESGGSGAVTLANYTRLFSSSVFSSVLLNSFVTAATVTVLCLLLGYPLAYVINMVGPRWRGLMLAAVVTPVLVGALIRSFAWIALLENRGIVNSALMATGLTEAPEQLVYNRLGLMIGMVNVMLPFCVLPIVNVMRGIDTRLVPAASSLGASPARAFWRVFFPLSMPGVSAGALLTFLLSLGFYITPALLGGRQDTMIAQLIQVQVMNIGDFNAAAAMGWVLMGTTVVLLLIYNRFFDLSRVFGGRA